MRLKSDIKMFAIRFVLLMQSIMRTGLIVFLNILL